MHMLLEGVIFIGTVAGVASMKGGGAIPTPSFITFLQMNLVNTQGILSSNS